MTTIDLYTTFRIQFVLRYGHLSKFYIWDSGILMAPDTLPEHKVVSEHEKISLFTTLIYQSCYLQAPSRVLSGVLVSTAGSGKTMNLAKFRHERHVYYTNVISPKHLVDFFKKVDVKNKLMMVIPDFLTVTDGNKTTRDNIIKLLRVVTEEGIDDVSHYGYPEIHFNNPVRAGLLTATTMDNMNEFKRVWKNNGFLSRLLPFSYSLGNESRDRIQKRIKNVESLKEREYKVILSRKVINRSPKKIDLPEILSYRLDPVALKLSDITGSINAPFRQEKQIYTLAKAHCALRRSDTVNEIDINAILSLSDNINLGFNSI